VLAKRLSIVTVDQLGITTFVRLVWPASYLEPLLSKRRSRLDDMSLA
jgi:hypothetical protein